MSARSTRLLALASQRVWIKGQVDPFGGRSQTRLALGLIERILLFNHQVVEVVLHALLGVFAVLDIQVDQLLRLFVILGQQVLFLGLVIVDGGGEDGIAFLDQKAGLDIYLIHRDGIILGLVEGDFRFHREIGLGVHGDLLLDTSRGGLHQLDLGCGDGLDGAREIHACRYNHAQPHQRLERALFLAHEFSLPLLFQLA